jgi:protocatechuate 3,4-dioxygenase beta subunit
MQRQPKTMSPENHATPWGRQFWRQPPFPGGSLVAWTSACSDGFSRRPCLLIIATLLLALTAAAQTTPLDQTGTITGTVTDAITKLPIKKTIVSVNPMGNFNGRNPGSSAATTDAAGAFTLTNLQPGKYRMSFQNQTYPQARFGQVSKTVEVKAGETNAPVTMELMPGAALTGHIVDEDGDPLPNCFVQLHPAKNPQQGVNMSGSTGSNQDGEYRSFGIPAGKYIVSAQCRQALFQARPFRAGPDPPPSKAYPMLYYPLTTESKSADVIELIAGNEKSGIDFQMKPAAVTQVRGAFSPTGADWHGNNIQVLLTSPDRRGINAVQNIFAPIDQTKGTFEFKQVFPGSYELLAFTNGGDENRAGASLRVDVGDRPIALTVELRHAIELTGKIEIESSGNNTNTVIPSQINIALNAENQMGNMGQQSSQVNDDGTFTLKGVMPGRFRLQANGPLMFLKSAWLGSTDITTTPMDLSSGATGTLRVVISTNTATIRGSAPAGEMVCAQRVDEQGNRCTGVDQNGQYKIEGLAPQKYRLIARDGGGPFPDEGGQEVTVHEGETVMLDLKAQN